MNGQTSSLFFDLKQLDATARQASRKAQEDARRHGISFVVMRGERLLREYPDGRIAQILPNGRHKLVAVRRRLATCPHCRVQLWKKPRRR